MRGEAQVAASLTHTNVARVFDYNEASAGWPPYVVMEFVHDPSFVHGPSMAHVITHAPMHPARALGVR
jgi:serine/threonine protein kinase